MCSRASRRQKPTTPSDAPEHKEAELEEAVEKGGRCEAKEVYYVRGKDPREYFYVDDKPEDEDEENRLKTKKARDAYAIVKFCHRVNGEWKLQSIQINNNKIRSVLEEVLEGYPGLTQHSLDSFSPPFLSFYHRWQEFIDSIGSEFESQTKQYLGLLRDILESELEQAFIDGELLTKTGYVSFTNLDLAFDPGEVVYVSSDGCSSAAVFREGQYGQSQCGKYFLSKMDVVDWDGRRCGFLSETRTIWEYNGLRAVTALDVSPLKAHANKDEISTALIRRGRQFEKLRGQFFMAYTDEHEERVSERTMIDARAYHKFGPPSMNARTNNFPDYAKLSEIGRLSWSQSMNRYSSSLNDGSDKPMEVDITPLTDEQCMLAVPTVKCFNIETKKWDKLDLTKFHEIPWAERAFDNLVLDASEKDLLLALIDRDEFKSKKSFDDFISGKGKGMIMLLCGPPGVGKTLSAETVAEHLRRPLYKMGAGDLGVTAASVEESLDAALKLCSHWKAVLLIDEADVYMEARTSDNLQRNELVSIFLRLLEYYSGIMILTTNRMRSLDSAFESRIDITLTYNELSEDDRKQVWRNFVAVMDPKDVDIDEAAVCRLAKWQFNGRQIKSAIKTAKILAAKKNTPLNEKHLEVVLSLRDKALGAMREEEVQQLALGKEARLNGNGTNGAYHLGKLNGD